MKNIVECLNESMANVDDRVADLAWARELDTDPKAIKYLTQLVKDFDKEFGAREDIVMNYPDDPWKDGDFVVRVKGNEYRYTNGKFELA